jgi:uncharacterized protein YodC (DUF2158 family)
MTIGDKVVLKGGSPVLTVCNVGRYNGRVLAEVKWFDDGGKLLTDHLPPEALTAYNDAKT